MVRVRVRLSDSGRVRIRFGAMIRVKVRDRATVKVRVKFRVRVSLRVKGQEPKNSHLCHYPRHPKNNLQYIRQ